MKSNCLKCHYYKVCNVESGLCRVLIHETGNKMADKPQVSPDHHCKKWRDAGQQYYIRLGWLKNKNKPNSI